MMITRLSKQGGRRYGQMGGSMQIAWLSSIGTTATLVVTGQSPGASRLRWGFHDSTVYR